MAKNNNKLRHTVQGLWTLITNSYLVGFLQGKIYTGTTKTVCVPGLNCYSCPGAMGSCPIGSLQAVTGYFKYNISFYVLGFISLIGVFLGRFICGWLCPFGLVQDLLNKIPLKNINVPKKFHEKLKYLKYIVLVVFVFLLPIIMQDDLGMSDPYFCKYICPSGTLFGGIPLVSSNITLRSTIGALFTWKVSILIGIIILSIIIFRPFCKYLCPLGAFYAIFNKVSLYNIKVDNNCTSCGACSKVCKMKIDVVKTPNNMECIRCGDCKKVCPQGAIHIGIFKDSMIESSNKNL